MGLHEAYIDVDCLELAKTGNDLYLTIAEKHGRLRVAGTQHTVRGREVWLRVIALLVGGTQYSELTD